MHLRSRLRRLSQPKEPAPGEEAEELNIVPFLDIIMNVLMFVLASMAIVFTVSLVVSPPTKPRVVGTAQPESVSLTVIVTTDGFTLKGKSGTVATGCQGVGAGPTIPRIPATESESFDGKKYDYPGLRRCMRSLKSQFGDERQIILTANPNVPFQEVVHVLDAVRRDDEGELFPEALFAVAQ